MRWPRITLQTRFTIVVAGAVAAVALAIAAVAFVAIRSDLQDRVNAELASHAQSVRNVVKHARNHENPGQWIAEKPIGFGTLFYTELVTSTGSLFAPDGDPFQLPVTPEAREVAAGSHPPYYSTVHVDGISAEVLTTSVAPGYAVLVAEPLTDTNAEVTLVGEILATLSVIGVVLAGLLGWAVARAGLSPVARLARVAEEVSRTGDPDRRVAVGRKDELGRLATTFNDMLGALQRSLDAQRRLVSDASHELRTPLASLRINVEVMAENPDLPATDRKEILDRVTNQVEELSRLVSSVTDLARGEPPAADRAPVDLNSVVAGALEAARRDWPGTEFTASLAGGIVEGTAERLRVAVKNLLDNAAKFGPPQGPIEVHLDGGELTVRDYGPGIEPEDQPFVFDRFYRALSSRSAPGSGLGLAVVQEIVTCHDGTVEAEDAPGEGALIRVQLPLSVPQSFGAAQPSGSGASGDLVKNDQIT